MTLRADAAAPGVLFMGSDGRPPEYLNVGNISELICTRLASGDSGTDVINAVSYLSGCYKRILNKESSANAKAKEDLVK
jgi:hypothetical protein